MTLWEVGRRGGCLRRDKSISLEFGVSTVSDTAEAFQLPCCLVRMARRVGNIITSISLDEIRDAESIESIF